MGMPNKFSFKPLAAHTLIAELDTNFIDLPLDLFDTPFAKPYALATPFHTANVLIHGLEDRGKPDGRMLLDEDQGFSFSRRSRWSRRGQRHPGIVQSA
jgi:hypothetical protein